jgi:hypothetical protein
MEPERTYLEPQTLMDYTTLSEQKKACRSHQPINKICYEEKIEYPDVKSFKDKSIVPLLRDDIKEMIQSFKKVNLFKEIDDEVYSNSTFNLYEHSSYHIFAITPKIVTTETTLSSYSGGAHGNYGIDYENIDKKSKKKLKLQDILKPNQTKAFTKFVESFYRKRQHLSPNDSLKDAGWFNDEFTLAENFAITPQGLYFLYNSYEIEPYAMGQETILLPYEQIVSFLSPKYFDKATLKEMKRVAHSYKKTFDKSLNILVTPVGEHRIKIALEANNILYDTTQGWLSVSFKELTGKSAKVKLLHKDFDEFHTYPAGSKIYNIKKKKAIKSQYLMVESAVKKWKEDEKRKLEFELEVPKDMKHLTMLLRVVYKFNGRTIEPETNGDDSQPALLKGQQGHNNFVLKVDF